MGKALLATLVLAAIAGISAANAQDLPQLYKAPVPSAVSWTGPYIGGSFGGEWGVGNWTATSLRDPPGIPPRIGVELPIDASSPASYDPASLRVGLLAGYDWQWMPRWVAGVEADVAWANGAFDKVGFPGCSLGPCTFPGSGFNAPVDQTAVDLGWNGTARVRVGYLISPDLLAYATGGFAWQEVSARGTCGPLIESDYCNGVRTIVPSSITNATTFVGGTVGAGLEWRLFGNLAALAEYRFSDFASQDEVFRFGFSPVAGDNTYRFRLALQTHTALFGLAYKFNGLGTVH
jgi:outer membrane immunogenic protein